MDADPFSQVDADIPLSDSVDRSSPVHPRFEELEQYRLKVRTFSKLGPELTIQRVSFEPEVDRYWSAYHAGRPSVGRPTGKRRSGAQTEESLQRAQRRAHTNVRLLVQELAPSALVTFTTRETMPLDALLGCWQHFARLMRQLGQDFEYVAVPERHPSNPNHLHLHVAYRGRTNFGIMRRCWHIALEARHGRRVTSILRGVASPGNIDVQKVKAREDLRRIKKIARYIAKYITKDVISEFNRKRYWPSKGIDLADARVYWLSSLSQGEAILEALGMFGEIDAANPYGNQVLFRPSDRVCWVAIDHERSPSPF